MKNYTSPLMPEHPPAKNEEQLFLGQARQAEPQSCAVLVLASSLSNLHFSLNDSFLEGTQENLGAYTRHFVDESGHLN